MHNLTGKTKLLLIIFIIFSYGAAAQNDDPIVDPSGPSLDTDPIGAISGAVTGLINAVFDLLIPTDWSSLSSTQQLFYGSSFLLVLVAIYLIVYFGADELDLINDRDANFDKKHVFGISLILAAIFMGSGQFFFFADKFGLMLVVSAFFLFAAFVSLVMFGGAGAVYGALGWGSKGAKKGYKQYTGSPAQTAVGKIKSGAATAGAAAGAAGIAGIGAVYSAYKDRVCGKCGQFGPSKCGNGNTCSRCKDQKTC